MNPRLRDAWTPVQRAETLLFQAAALLNMAQYRKLIAEIGLEGESLYLLLRIVRCFDPDQLSPQDYLTRYPFSSVNAIRRGLDRLVESGYMSRNRADSFAATELARQRIYHFEQGVAELMQSVDLGDFPPEDVQKLLEYDLRILESLKAASRPHGYPILRHRLRGLQPSYDPPQRWHHWMHVWTMLAASEDEEEYIRQLRGIDALEWFVRRQIWFAHRRPWRARAITLKTLIHRATRYSPIDDAEQALSRAVWKLKARNWLEESEGEFRLTEGGLTACDDDEREIDAGFLSCWPGFSEVEIEELIDITTRLNDRFMELIPQN